MCAPHGETVKAAAHSCVESSQESRQKRESGNPALNRHDMQSRQALNELFPVGEICVSHVRFRSPAYRRALRYFEERPKGLRRIARGDRLGKWMVMHPEATDRFAQADDNSLVLLGIF